MRGTSGGAGRGCGRALSTLVALALLVLGSGIAGANPTQVSGAEPGDARVGSPTAALVAPVATVPGPWTDVTMGGETTCAHRADGTVTCWGLDGQAQPPAGSWLSIALGGYHGCGLRPDQTVECWGSSAYGTYGELAAPAGTYVSVSAGQYTSCAIATDMTGTCWGSDKYGQRTVPPGTWSSIQAIGHYACGLHTDGTAECWGNNGSPPAAPPGTWTDLSFGDVTWCGIRADASIECSSGYNDWLTDAPAGPWVEVHVGGGFACGRRPDGSGACWGRQTYAPATAAVGPWTRMATKGSSACGLAPSGDLRCWNALDNVPYIHPATGFVQVALGVWSGCSRQIDGQVQCFGYKPVPNHPDGSFTTVGVGVFYACGLRPTGEVTCWGDNTYGQRNPPPGPFVDLDVGDYHACAVRPDGTGACWGQNSSGETDVPDGTWAHLVAGSYLTCGIHPDGTSTCWGIPSLRDQVPSGPWKELHLAGGFCGLHLDGTAECSINWGFPTKPTPAGTFTDLSFGDWLACGRRADSSVECWGKDAPSNGMVPPAAPGGLAASGYGICVVSLLSEIRCVSGGYLPTLSSVAESRGSVFVAVPPTRVLDSREPASGWGGPLGPGEIHSVGVTGRTGVPFDATAVVLNVTATNPTAASYLSVHPGTASSPTAANLLYAPGQTVANHVTVPVGPGGAIAFTNQLGDVDVIADLVGYYVPDTSPTPGDRYDPTTPTRILDTRTGLGLTPSTSSPVGPDGTIDLTIAGVAGVPAGATAAVFNLTATEPTAPTYVQAYPAGTPRPDTANLLVAPGQTLPNLVTVALGTNGNVTLYNQHGNVHLIADLVGWYQPDTGDLFHPLTPTRLLDSRTPLGGFNGPIGPNTAKTLTVTGGPIPTGATAIVANLTATGGTAATYLAAGPTPTPIPAPTANLLAAPGQTIPNAATITLAPTGTLDLYNQTGTTHTILDATGWFGP